MRESERILAIAEDVKFVNTSNAKQILFGDSVPDTIDAKSVQKAYFKLSLFVHPDMAGGSEDAFKVLGAAKDILNEQNLKKVNLQNSNEVLMDIFRYGVHNYALSIRRLTQPYRNIQKVVSDNILNPLQESIFRLVDLSFNSPLDIGELLTQYEEVKKLHEQIGPSLKSHNWNEVEIRSHMATPNSMLRACKAVLDQEPNAISQLKRGIFLFAANDYQIDFHKTHQKNPSAVSQNRSRAGGGAGGGASAGIGLFKAKSKAKKPTIEELKIIYENNGGGWMATRQIFGGDPNVEEAITRLQDRLKEKMEEGGEIDKQGATYKTLVQINQLPPQQQSEQDDEATSSKGMGSGKK